MNEKELRNVNLEELLEVLTFMYNSDQEKAKGLIWWCEDNNLVLGIDEDNPIYVIPNKVIFNA